MLRDFRHPVAIVTKSPLILRDLDILSEMASMGLAKAALSITTLDRKLARADGAARRNARPGACRPFGAWSMRACPPG